VTLPGPSAGAWALGLVVWAAAAAVLGESLRLGVARWVPAWRRDEPIQRLLLDFYLGGAVLYLVAALPFDGFQPAVVYALPIAGAAAIVAMVALRRRSPQGPRPLASLAALRSPAYVTTLLSALALFAFEVALAVPIGAGNTFDSGLLTTYTSLLLRNHTIAASFQPYATSAILYPQGAPVWLGWAELTLGLPAARTSLIVTPLFMALAPLAGFVFGRRWFGTNAAGAAIALALTFLAPATRDMVAGSNDFVFAFPLVLLLAAEMSSWIRAPSPGLGDAVGFGILAGYSAAINPVGAEWLFLALLVGALVARPSLGGAPARWIGRWIVAIAVALVGILPSLVVLAQGISSPGLVPGAPTPPPGTPTGIGTPTFLGSIDPFLFRPEDVQLSMVASLRAELAILLVVGLAALILLGRASAFARYLEPFRTFVIAAVASLIGLLAVVWAASTEFGPAVAFSEITSYGELSTWLFTIYVLIAMVPLVVALERLGRVWTEPVRERSPPPEPSEGRGRRRRPGGASARVLVPLAIALVIVVPGGVLTPTSLAPVLTDLYHDFGNVTSDDYALLEYAGSHLPPGARVLVAPGSAGDFLPGYAANVVMLYPLVPGWPWLNGSYNVVVAELSNGTLNASGRAAMSDLDVQYVIVTGNSTVLWPAFSPAPLLRDPGTFPLLWHAGDAYLFART